MVTNKQGGEMEFLKQCAEAMSAYQQLTQDKGFASRVDAGRMQLVRVTYDEKGESHIEECSDWMPADKWLAFIDSISV